MYRTAKAADGTSIKRFFSKASARLIDELSRALGGTEEASEDPWRNLRKDVGDDAQPVILREQLMPNGARVWVRERNQPGETALRFVREDDAWRLDFTDELKTEMKDLPQRIQKANDLHLRLTEDKDSAREALLGAERDQRSSPR